MAYLDRADCLVRAKNRLNRPATDTAFTRSATDDIWLDFMTEANDELTKLIATFIPDIMVGSPLALSTADSGKTYTFGTDIDSANVFPLGWFSIFESRESMPDYPLVPGVDYTIEGTKIRIPNNNTRTFADGGPWVQMVPAANVITSSSQPTIPVLCRLAMVERMCEKASARLGMDPSPFEQQFAERWNEVLYAVRTQVMSKYGDTMRNRGASWWANRRRI